MVKKKSLPLKWHGGKRYLAKRIIEMMPKHKHYVETHFGGGSVLFAKNPEDVSEVVNDINGELMNFWRMLQDRPVKFQVLYHRLQFVPFSQEGWERACVSKPYKDIDRAVNFFICYRQSRQGLGKDFATLSRNRTRRGMNEQVSSWLSAIEGLPEAHTRLKRVVILNDDALKVIRQQDGKHTLFYLDPPYLHETRVTTEDFRFEMSREDHNNLLELLTTIKGDFLLSGYRSSLYDQVARRVGWLRRDFRIDCKASGKKKKPKRTECVWYNF